MAQSFVFVVPVAAILGLIIWARRKTKAGKVKCGAFIEEFEINPPPAPKPPAAPPLLTGLTFAVKDIIDIEGTVTGFGTPDWKKTHKAATQTAPVVENLIAAGAKCVGKTHMDEMAYSINGENKPYGTPINPAAPQHIPGGSSSGSAVAVAGGFVDFALGTDTGGSIRVPAAFCGILGFRPSHGAVSVQGVIPMATSFDTLGCFAREVEILQKVGHVLLQQPYVPPRPPRKVIIADDLFELSTAPRKPVISAIINSVEKLLGSGRGIQRLKLGEYLSGHLPSLEPFLSNQGTINQKDVGKATLTAVRDAMRVLQGFEFAQSHGEWLALEKPKLSPDIASRVKFALSCSEEQATKVKAIREEMQKAMTDLLQDDALLALPSVGGLPPKLKTKPEALDEYRSLSFTILAVSGMSGCPQVSIPAGEDGSEDLPLAVSLLARHGADSFLLHAVEVIAPEIASQAMELAEAARQEPQQSRPNEAQQAKEKGNAAYKAKDFKAALAHYSEAIRIDGGRSSIYYNNRAMAYLQLCKFDEAEVDCTSALERDRRNVKAMLRRGTAREFLGYYQSALEDFNQVLVYEPNNKSAAEAIERMRSNVLMPAPP